MSESTSPLLKAARNKLEDWLINKGLRRSSERFALLDEVYARNDHFDVEELFTAMQHKGYPVSRATVYNTLEVLVACGLVRQHQFGDEENNKHRYEKSLGRQQHGHLICTVCHQVKEFCDPRLHFIKTNVGNVLQFNVDAHSLILYGECTDDTCEHKVEERSETKEARGEIKEERN